MNVRQLFRLLLAVLLTAGLTVAPLAAPAVAAEHAMPAKMMQMADMGDMAAATPCCPDKQKGNACQDCPLIAICMLQVLVAGPPGQALLIRDPSHQRLHPLDDIIADASARPPPDHPLRHLV
jgi:hypothetical protein